MIFLTPYRAMYGMMGDKQDWLIPLFFIPYPQINGCKSRKRKRK